MNYHRLEMLISYFEAYKKADIYDRETAVNQKGAEIQIKREREKNSRCLSMMYSTLMFSYVLMLSLFL